MAKKTSKTTSDTKTEKQQYAQLPEGYTAIGGMAKTWDYQAEPLLEGTIVSFSEAEVKRGKKTETVPLCIVERQDGSRVTVWKSATLSPLFEEFEEGTQIAIAYQGLGTAKKGQNPPKLFALGYIE